MKTIKHTVALTGLVILLFTGCERVLDKRNYSEVDPNLWNIEIQANLYLNKIYGDNMPTIALGSNSGYSDETFNANDFIYGQLSIGDVGEFSLANYRKIRDINIMLDGMENSTLAEDIKEPLIAQAAFFRAWRYWELVRLYGGVPMVLRAQDPFYENLDVPRSKTSECIDIITEDLDMGIQVLPGSWVAGEDYGRLTRGAAAAFKGRILLFWASPQFNPDPNDPEDRWQRAYDANLEAKNILDEDGYGLFDVFSSIFLTEGHENTEAVLIRSYDEDYFPNEWESTIRPPSGGGNGTTNPTQALVDAFPMINGKAITDPSSGYDELYYWKNRDPRFKATIAWNGCEWILNGREGTRQWTYLTNSQEDRRAPATGYYCRKANNPDIHKDDVERTPTDWIEIRYAEVLLNLAECANELDKREEAYTLIAQIRDRAGIEPGTDDHYGLPSAMDRVAMREAVMRERQIELAFENKRYWDLRRRNMYAEDLGPNTPKLNETRRMGIRVLAQSPFSADSLDVIRDTIDVENRYDTYFRDISKIMDSQYSINYPQPLYNFFAIPPALLDRSPAVEQTAGWEDGTFDPYQ